MGACKKKRFRRQLDAKIALALRGKSPKRREIRFYWHAECKAYHLTSQEYKPWESSGEQRGGSTPLTKRRSSIETRAAMVASLAVVRITLYAPGLTALMTRRRSMKLSPEQARKGMKKGICITPFARSDISNTG